MFHGGCVEAGWRKEAGGIDAVGDGEHLAEAKAEPCGDFVAQYRGDHDESPAPEASRPALHHPAVQRLFIEVNPAVVYSGDDGPAGDEARDAAHNIGGEQMSVDNVDALSADIADQL